MNKYFGGFKNKYKKKVGFLFFKYGSEKNINDWQK